MSTEICVPAALYDLSNHFRGPYLPLWNVDRVKSEHALLLEAVTHQFDSKRNNLKSVDIELRV